MDRRDATNRRVTTIQLKDRHGRIVEAKFGDVVRIRGASGGAAANQEGTIDGFTEHRTRVLLSGCSSCRFFKDENLMFVRSTQTSTPRISREVKVSPSVVEEDEIEEDHLTVDTHDSVLACNPNGDPETYFTDLTKHISNYALASTDLAIHLVLGRKHFQKKNQGRFDGRKARHEFNKRLEHLNTFLDGLKNGIILED